MDGPHLWEIRWVRDLFVLLVVALILTLAFSVRAILSPVLIAMALAYIVDPLLEVVRRRARISRLISTVLLLAAGLLATGLILLFLLPSLIGQLDQLVAKVPDYVHWLKTQIDWEWARDAANRFLGDGSGKSTEATGPVTDLKTVGATLLRVLGFGLNVIGSAINLTLYFSLAAVVLGFSFFIFSWKLDVIRSWFSQFIPVASRDRTLHVLGRMDSAVSAFVRGRLIQAVVMGIVLSIGWGLFGVPYFLLLGLVSGLSNLVPFAAVIGWLLAVALAVVDHASNPGSEAMFKLSVIILPTIVYTVAQGLDGWVVEPIVQGKATDLDPLTVLLAVLIGGALAGLAGLILAIPVTACLKILGQEVLVPRLRAVAQREPSRG